MPRDDLATWPAALAIAALASEFCISANLLTWIGIPYVTEGGMLLEKIHPGTYMLCLAFMARIAHQDRPNRFLWSLAGGDRRLFIYLACLMLCLIYMLLTTGTGNVIVLLDTFLSAGLFACVFQGASAKDRRILRMVFRCGVSVNAILALAEAAAHTTLVPLYLNDSAYQAGDGEFRPTALYDHPLTGGITTLIGLALAPQERWLGSAYIVLLSMALIAFGGRVTVATAMLSIMVFYGRRLINHVARRDAAAFRLLSCYGLSACACGIIAAAAFALGLGDRLIGHLYWDPSAQVRLAQWSLLGELDAWQIVFGTRREDLLVLLQPLWLNSGVEVIENFWLLMFLSLGMLGFPIFALALSSLIMWCWERTELKGHLLLASVLAVVSTSNSLGRKSTLLVFLIAAIMSIAEKRHNKLPTVLKVSGFAEPQLTMTAQ